MSRRARIAAWIAGSVGVVLLGAAVFAWVRAGDLVERRATTMARERYGLDLRVGDARVSTSGVTLHDVEVRMPGVDGFFVRLEEVVLHGSPLSIALRRLAGVSGVEVHRGEVHVRATDDVLEALAALRGRGSSRPVSSTGAGSDRPPVEVRGLVVEIVDDQGALIRLLDLGANVRELAIDASLATAELGDLGGDHMQLVGARARLVRDERWRVSELEANEAHVRWALALEQVSGAEDHRLVRRLRELLSRARHALARDAADAADEAPSSRLDRFTTRDLAIDIGETDISTGEGAAQKRLSLHESTMRRLDATRIGLVGRGEGEGGIEARWNLEIDPSASRAEGTLRLQRVPLALVGPIVPDIPWEASMPGLVSVDVELRAEGLDRVAARGSVAVEGAAIDSRRISAAPIRDLALRIEGEGELLPQERRLVLGGARISTGGVVSSWSGRIELGGGRYRAQGSLVLEDTECERAVHAIPADVLGTLSGFRLEGRIAGRLDVDLDSESLGRTRLDVTVDDRCTFLAAPAEADLTRFEGPFHHEVLEPDGTVFAMDTGPGTSSWARYDAISPSLVVSVLSHEDAAFFQHRGFAPWAIRDALVRNLQEGRYVVGASTITMQLAKNLFLHREKTLIRKVQEVLLTWWLERSLTKEQILELYFNVIEYGPSIYGIRAASNYYFDCAPAALSPVAAAFLANILPAPKRYGVPPSGALSPGMQQRLERFIRHMAERQRIDPETLEAAIAELATFRFRSGGGSNVPRVIAVDPQFEQASESGEGGGGPEDYNWPGPIGAP